MPVLIENKVSPAITPSALNVLDFGAKQDGVTDDAPAITATLAAANANQQVFLPGGTLPYLVNSTIEIGTRQLLGISVNAAAIPTVTGTIIKAGTGFVGTEVIKSTFGCSVKDIIIECDSQCDYGLNMQQGFTRTVRVTNVTVLRSNVAGFYFDRCQVALIDRCLAESGSGAGFIIEAGNHFIADMCSANNNATHGFIIQKSVAQPVTGGYAQLLRCQCESNGADGIQILGSAAISSSYLQMAHVVGCILEDNDGHGIYSQFGSHLKIRDNRILGKNLDLTTRCIYLTECLFCDVEGNRAPNVGGHTSYNSIKNLLDGSSTNDFGSRNLHLSDISSPQMTVEIV